MILIFFTALKAIAFDQDLTDRLKQDLQHDAQRKKAYKQYQSEKQENEKERDKGLSLYLEEQEQWEFAREKTVYEYKKSKKKSLDEDSPEYFADLAEKKKNEQVINEARKKHIRQKTEVIAQYSGQQDFAEEDELQIFSKRPRYEQRKRGKNKWTKSGQGLGGSTGSSGSGDSFSGGSGGFDLPPPLPPGDFNNFPQDSFDDFPPPVFDGNMPGNYDSGFGEGPIPPPPPPMQQDGFDF